MGTFKEKIQELSKWNRELKNNKILKENHSLPGNTYILDDNDILSLPRDDGDCRYPYGRDGFNFWAYTSGYMHCNEGLFSVFLRANEGQEPKVAFFAGFPIGNGTYKPVSLLSVPAARCLTPGKGEFEQFTVFSRSSVYYITETHDMRFTLRIFPDRDRKLYFTLYIENLEAEKKELYISSFINPFLNHSLGEDGESRWFREVSYIEASSRNNDLGSFKIKVNEDISRTTSVSNIGVIRRFISISGDSALIRHEESASRYEYVGGSRGSLHAPAALEAGSFRHKKHICAFTEAGAAADIIHLRLQGNECIRYDAVLGYRIHCRSEDEAGYLLSGQFTPAGIDLRESELREQSVTDGKDLTLKVDRSNTVLLREGIFNSFFEHLKTQVEFCSLIKGYVQLSAGSLIGIRDIFQALEGLVYWQPDKVRRKMLEAMEFVLEDGRCPRQYTLPTSPETPPVMDLRLFIDQGVWVISAMNTYIRVTGDREILSEVCGYYEIVDEKKSLVRKSKCRDSVLEHLFKIMKFLLSNRDTDQTGCIKVLYGDWNDALDGLGVSIDPNKEYGTGVSVMASLQVYQNLNEMAQLLLHLNAAKYAEEIRYYKETAEELRFNLQKYAVISNDCRKKRIVHGWGDRRSYFVGSFDDPDHVSRTGLTSNVFWVLSGLNSTDRYMEDTILDSFRALDTKYGFKTFDHAFSPNTPGVGRIPRLPAGTAENGAVYVHASAFAVMALFQMGRPKEAWEQLIKLFPFTHRTISCSPYVMPNSYGFNEEKGIDGESMLDWQTGSSNVILKTLIRFVMGIEPDFDGIWLQPAQGLPFKGFTFDIKIKGCRLKVQYKNSGKGARTYFLNDIKREGIYSEAMKLDRLWISHGDLKTSVLKILVED